MFPSFSTCVVGSHHHVSTDRRERHNDANILFGMGDQEEEQQRNSSRNVPILRLQIASSRHRSR